MDVQTELYLEELSDRVEEADVECQTDAFLDRPPSPLFIPAKSGTDVCTQINDGDVRCKRGLQFLGLLLLVTYALLNRFLTGVGNQLMFVNKSARGKLCRRAKSFSLFS